MSVTPEQLENAETNLASMLSVGDHLLAFDVGGVQTAGNFYVEAVTKDWVVARDSSGLARFVSVSSWMKGYEDQIARMVNSWINE